MYFSENGYFIANYNRKGVHNGFVILPQQYGKLSKVNGVFRDIFHYKFT